MWPGSILGASTIYSLASARLFGGTRGRLRAIDRWAAVEQLDGSVLRRRAQVHVPGVVMVSVVCPSSSWMALVGAPAWRSDPAPPDCKIEFQARWSGFSSGQSWRQWPGALPDKARSAAALVFRA